VPGQLVFSRQATPGQVFWPGGWCPTSAKSNF